LGWEYVVNRWLVVQRALRLFPALHTHDLGCWFRYVAL
jgi:hypothetical protein